MLEPEWLRFYVLWFVFGFNLCLNCFMAYFASDVKVLERIEEAHNASGAQENVYYAQANVYYGDESEASQVPVNPVR